MRQGWRLTLAREARELGLIDGHSFTMSSLLTEKEVKIEQLRKRIMNR